MKKILSAIGIFFGLLLAAILVLPFVVDVDKYRPQIVEVANRNIHGSLELGKLSLSLWGQIRIEVGGLKLKDSLGREVVGVQDAYFHLPFWSLLSGSPVLTFKMNRPTVHVLKDKSGQFNVMTLVVKKNLSSPPIASPANPTGTTQQEASPLPLLVTRARLGIELNSALINYKDEATGLSTQVKDLNFRLKDISLSHPTELELWADFDTRLGKAFQLRGPARLTGKAQPTLKNGKIESVSLISQLDMDSVEISAAEMFQKKKGMAANVSLSISASENEAKIEKMVLKFFNAEVSAEGTLTSQGSSSSPSPVPWVRLALRSNPIEFKPWVELIPLLKDYELGGSAQVEANVNGPSQKLGYSGKLILSGLTAKAPRLKAQPRIDGVVHWVTDQVDQILLTLKAPANDLKIQGKMISFAHPRMDFDVTSTGMDLDQLIEFPPSAAKAPAAPAPEAKTGSSPSRPSKPGTSEDFDALLEPLRENKVLADLVANVSIDMKKIKAKNVQLSEILCKMSFKDLAAGLNQCGFKVFSGAIHADASLQMKPKSPTYQFNASLADLDLSQAVESQMALARNTLRGHAGFTIQGQGSSLNPDSAITQLKAKGNFKVTQATFATVDVMKMVGEALSKTMSQMGDKIPALKGKSLGNLPNRASLYEFVTSDFKIDQGQFSAPNFYAKAAANQGIDIKGNTTVGLKDDSLSTSWDIIDTYNLTQMKDISVEQNGVRVEHLFSEGGAPVHFPMHAGCTLTKPCYTSVEVPIFLGKVALTNIGNALTGQASARAKEEARKQAESLLKAAPPALQNQLNKFFH